MLIVLRGNSGSGKTTTAKLLRESILADKPEQRIALIEQDYFSRTVLKEKEKGRGDNVELIRLAANFALKRGYHIILEGIMRAERYESMIKELARQAAQSHFYYFDIPLDETIRRHSTKPNAHEFGEPELRSWFKDKDLLSFTDEKIIAAAQSQPEIVEMIRQDTGL